MRGIHIGNLCIRDARVEDRDQIEEHLLEAYQQYEQHLSTVKWERYKEEIRQSVTNSRTLAFIVAVLDSEIVGSVQLFVSSEAAYAKPELGIDSPIIRFLAVSPKARGHGIAAQLIAESIHRMERLGATTLHLHTTDMMASAIKLYERLGFTRAIEKDFSNGETLVKSYWLRL
ncbi:GNAT family N-acetyltransferase [Brevibacillus sp. HB1.2]|uniref:GNAT family N-acetyltransferase n=1 Tax=unclassified Brevibacillus TaxID=2684853 RepID=UPI00156A91D1|nr:MULTISPECIES: GNAT family N-acetyltransferase [unclassified Brevibacillus]NRS15320.1 GNAT family N-acetyltransferase [Brevibacillus sp. HB1.4B]NTU19024.1 GNAT family N-acetyltransferase [Brevibacillus sp. HB1.2]NTU29831.1 GNAT family N-acetyltransferase [Brevibacillus sp. HB1.1]